MDVLVEILGSFSFMENNFHVHFKNSHSFAITRNLLDCKRHARNTWIIRNLLLQSWQWTGRGISLHLDTYQQKLNVCTLYSIPGTCLSSILVVEPFKTRSFPIKQGSFGFQVLLDSLISFWEVSTLHSQTMAPSLVPSLALTIKGTHWPGSVVWSTAKPWFWALELESCSFFKLYIPRTQLTSFFGRIDLPFMGQVFQNMG